MHRFFKNILLITIISISISIITRAQTAQIVVEPADVTMNINEQVKLSGKVISDNGALLSDTVYFFLQSRKHRRALDVSQEGSLIAYKPGVYGITARTFGEQKLQLDFDVIVAFPPVVKVAIEGFPT